MFKLDTAQKIKIKSASLMSTAQFKEKLKQFEQAIAKQQITQMDMEDVIQLFKQDKEINDNDISQLLNRKVKLLRAEPAPDPKEFIRFLMISCRAAKAKNWQQMHQALGAAKTIFEECLAKGIDIDLDEVQRQVENISDRESDSDQEMLDSSYSTTSESDSSELGEIKNEAQVSIIAVVFISHCKAMRAIKRDVKNEIIEELTELGTSWQDMKTYSRIPDDELNVIERKILQVYPLKNLDVLWQYLQEDLGSSSREELESRVQLLFSDHFRAQWVNMNIAEIGHFVHSIEKYFLRAKVNKPSPSTSRRNSQVLELTSQLKTRGPLVITHEMEMSQLLPEDDAISVILYEDKEKDQQVIKSARFIYDQYFAILEQNKLENTQRELMHAHFANALSQCQSLLIKRALLQKWLAMMPPYSSIKPFITAEIVTRDEELFKQFTLLYPQQFADFIVTLPARNISKREASAREQLEKLQREKEQVEAKKRKMRVGSEEIEKAEKIRQAIYNQIQMCEDEIVQEIRKTAPRKDQNSELLEMGLRRWSQYGQEKTGSLSDYSNLSLARVFSQNKAQKHQSFSAFSKVDFSRIDLHKLNLETIDVAFLSNLFRYAIKDAFCLRQLTQHTQFISALARINRSLLYRFVIKRGMEIQLPDKRVLFAIFVTALTKKENTLGKLNIFSFLKVLKDSELSVQEKFYPSLQRDKAIVEKFKRSQAKLFNVLGNKGLVRLIDVLREKADEKTDALDNDKPEVYCTDAIKAPALYKQLLHVSLLSDADYVDRFNQTGLANEVLSLKISEIASPLVRKLDARVRRAYLCNVNMLSDDKYEALVFALNDYEIKQIILSVFLKCENDNVNELQKYYSALVRTKQVTWDQIQSVLESYVYEKQDQNVLNCGQINLICKTIEISQTWTGDPRPSFKMRSAWERVINWAGELGHTDIFYNFNGALRQGFLLENIDKFIQGFCCRQQKLRAAQARDFAQGVRCAFDDGPFQEKLGRIKGLFQKWTKDQPDLAIDELIQLFKSIKTNTGEPGNKDISAIKNAILSTLLTKPSLITKLKDKSEIMHLVLYMNNETYISQEQIKEICGALCKGTNEQKQAGEKAGLGELRAMQELSAKIKIVTQELNLTERPVSMIFAEAGKEAKLAEKQLKWETTKARREEKAFFPSLWRMWHGFCDWVKGKPPEQKYVGVLENPREKLRASSTAANRQSSRRNSEAQTLLDENVNVHYPPVLAGDARQNVQSRRNSASQRLSERAPAIRADR